MVGKLLPFLLGGALAATAFNLWLTFRLIGKIRYLDRGGNVAQRLAPGERLPQFNAVQLEGAGYDGSVAEAKAYIFLSTQCDKCRGKLAELDGLRNWAQDAGVGLWLLSAEDRRLVTAFFEGTGLAASTLLLEQQFYDRLNPQGASPYYLFVDEEDVVQADGFIGDESWRGFVDQLAELQREAS